MYYSELKTLLKAKYGNQAQDAQILSWTNIVIQDLCRQLFEAQLKEYKFTTTARYVTGTVSGTTGTSTLTFAGGATITSDMTGRKIKIDDHNEIYKITYVAADTATTDTTLTETIAAGTTFTIYQDEYDLPSDFLSMKSMHRYDKFMDYNAVLWDRVYRQGAITFENPDEYTILGTNETSFYSTGNVTIAGTAATFGGGAVVPQSAVGKILQIAGSSNQAYITAVAVGGGSCTLDRSGLVANASSYMIDPPPRQKILIYPAPADDIHVMNVLYYRQYIKVINDSDVIPFPSIFHSLIHKGVDYYFAENQREYNMIQEAKKNFAYEMDNMMFLNNQQKLKGRRQSKTKFDTDAMYNTYPRTFIATGEG